MASMQKEIQVGDVVRILSGTMSGDHCVGDIGVVRRINRGTRWPYDVYVASKKGTNPELNTYWYSADQLEVQTPDYRWAFDTSFFNSYPYGLRQTGDEETEKGGKKSSMQKLTRMAIKLFDADTKTLIKAGILDECLDLTEEGKDFVLTQYLIENKVALAKEAKQLLKEKKEEEE